MESPLIRFSYDKTPLMHLGSCTSLREKTTAELPEEIMNEEILTQLPVEALLRIRCVCKSWESLFFTPDFVRAQFRSSINKHCVYQDCVVANTYEGYMLLTRFKQTLVEPPWPRYSVGSYTSLVGSINGLVCLVNRKEFFLWNPMIGRYREFIIPQEHVPPNVVDKCYRYLIGFCWDCCKNDYQVVVCYLFGPFRQGVVYSSNSNSWTKLVVPNFVFPSRVFESANGIEHMTPTTIVKECPYWCYSKYLPKMRRKYTSLVKFEVQTQKFRSLPEIDYALVRGQNYNFANVKDCLAIMVYRSESPNTSVEVYVLHEKSGVWNKMCTIRSPQCNLNIWSLLQDVTLLDAPRGVDIFSKVAVPVRSFWFIVKEYVYHKEYVLLAYTKVDCHSFLGEEELGKLLKIRVEEVKCGSGMVSPC
ncbi:hypothetical protein ACET3Z_027359 [Daucus carota]